VGSITSLRRILLISFLPALAIGITTAQTNRPLPLVVQHAPPIYPPLARTARVEGDVHIKITTDGETVEDAEVESGHPLLNKAAEDNIRSWKFAPHEAGTFHVIFRYKLLSQNVAVEFLDSPSVVSITASPPELSIYYGDIGLGTWRVVLHSSHGVSRRLLSLSYTGADGEWLNGRVLSPSGSKSEETDQGYIKDGLLGFTINWNEPDGQHLRTFFVGKLSGKRIGGTFVDDAGVRGQWIGVRISPGRSNKP
jgi:TonB family protein